MCKYSGTSRNGTGRDKHNYETLMYVHRYLEKLVKLDLEERD